jgi:hypothetical protein
MRSRFTQEVLSIFQQMSCFTHSGLLNAEVCKEDNVQELCRHYDLDSALVVNELNEFRLAYRSVHSMVDVSDLVDHTRCSETSKKVQLETADSDNDDETVVESNEEDDPSSHDQSTSSVMDTRWIDHSYIKPLRVVTEVSSYPNLAVLYKILASLAVTSASAERVLSRVRIIKNRLRTAMVDDWFSALTVLAAEQDVMKNIRMEDIINSFSQCSSRLRDHLS